MFRMYRSLLLSRPVCVCVLYVWGCVHCQWVRQTRASPPSTPGPFSRRSVGNFQGWEFVHLLIAHYLLSSNEQLWAICSDRSGQMSDVSESLRLLTKNERCERITGFFEQITHSLIFLAKKERFAQKTNEPIPNPGNFFLVSLIVRSLNLLTIFLLILSLVFLS